jgi:hypothetical protein
MRQAPCVANSAEITGTRASMRLDNDGDRRLKSVFDALAEPKEYTFDKTLVPVRLAQHEGEKLVSRSEAQRVGQRFERFQEVVLDFDGVAEIGPAFADQLFRVFAAAHPDVRPRPINRSEAAAQRVRRAMSASATAKWRGRTEATRKWSSRHGDNQSRTGRQGPGWRL